MSRAFTKERDGEPVRSILVERPNPIPVTREGNARLRAAAGAATDPVKRAEGDARAGAAVVPAPPDDPDLVAFGATVTVSSATSGARDRYVLVGDDEIDVARGRIGIPSPLGIALLGKRVGEATVWKRPAGDETLTIEAVDYSELIG